MKYGRGLIFAQICAKVRCIMSEKGKRVLLTVRRWKQRPAECAIASATALAYYFDESVTYHKVRNVVPKSLLRKNEGLYTSQQARLLNDLGFGRIAIVTSDPTLVDMSWQKLSKGKIIEKLRRKRAYCGRTSDTEGKSFVDDMISWLQYDGCDNNLIIDYNFPMYIRRHLDAGKPVGASYNWTKMFKFKKTGVDEVRGEVEEHAVVIRGYDDQGVFIVDGHHQSYKGRLSKYHNGYYKMPWETYLVTAPDGDLILVY